MDPKEGEFDRFAPEHVSAVVGWLASDLSAGVTGQVLKVMGGQVQVLRGWRPVTEANDDKPWTITAIDEAADTLFAKDGPRRPAVHAGPGVHARRHARDDRARSPTTDLSLDDIQLGDFEMWIRPDREGIFAKLRAEAPITLPRGARCRRPRSTFAAGPGILGADALRRRDAGVARPRRRSTRRRAINIPDIPPEIAEWLGSMINMDAPEAHEAAARS